MRYLKVRQDLQHFCLNLMDSLDKVRTNSVGSKFLEKFQQLVVSKIIKISVIETAFPPTKIFHMCCIDISVVSRICDLDANVMTVKMVF